jgi:hypothetical protein
MYNYITTLFIFTLLGFQITELEPHRGCEEVWRVLEATYPDGFPTHTKVQKFYFEANDFLLQRLDYGTDIAGVVVVHYCFDYKSFEGLVFPTTKRVVKRTSEGKRVLTGQSSFDFQYVDVKIFDKDGCVHSGEKRVI